MTNEQKELLKAMHSIKNHCVNHDCDTCCLTSDNSRDGCPFTEVPARDWNLEPIEEEKNFSVFHKNT